MTTAEVLKEFDIELKGIVRNPPPDNAEIERIDFVPMRGWVRLIPYKPKRGKPYNEKQAMLDIFHTIACIIDEQHIPDMILKRRYQQ